jgi:hypothetical protein
MTLPALLPTLPAHNHPWSPNIHHAVQIIGDLYRSACSVLASGNFDLHRIQHHHTAVIDEALPLLLKLEEHRSDEDSSGQLDSWLQTCVQLFGELLVKLAEAEESTYGVCVL